MFTQTPRTPRTPPSNSDGDPADGPALAEFVPGRLWLGRGTPADYRALSTFHYRAGPPATWAGVVSVRHAGPCEPPEPPESAGRAVAVAVLSWPTRLSRPRREAFDLAALGYGEQIRFANAHLRTISRVVVHPQFRGLGLATAVIRAACEMCQTRYVEATAAMGAAHPMFERAGLTRHRGDSDRPAYFWLDKQPAEAWPNQGEARP